MYVCGMEIKIRDAILKGDAVNLFKRKEQELIAKQVNLPNKGIILNMVLNECCEILRQHGYPVSPEDIKVGYPYSKSKLPSQSQLKDLLK